MLIRLIMRKNIDLLLFIILALHFSVISRLQFTAWPEMVSFPYLINNGFVLYKDAIHAYPPLLVTVLAILFKFFGYKLIVLQLFGWISILISDILIFFIVKKITDSKYLPIVSVLVYALLQPILEGNMVWPDLFLIPFLLSTFLLLLKKKYLYAGIALGLALLTKQTAIFYIACSIFYLFISERRRKVFVNFFVGIAICLVPLLPVLVKQNSLQDFLNWAIIYPSAFWTKFPGYVQIIPSKREFVLLAILITPLLYLILRNGKIIKDKLFVFLLFMFGAGLIGVYPRFSFFHFQPALVFLIVLYSYVLRNLNPKFLYIICLIPAFVFLVNFRTLKIGEARFWGEDDVKLGELIGNRTNKDETIYLLGLNSNLYAFADRQPSKPWLDNFGWYLEIPGVQEKVVDSFEKNPPSNIYWRTPDNGNWYDLGVYQPKQITDWINKNYNKEGEVEKGVWEWKRK